MKRSRWMILAVSTVAKLTLFIGCTVIERPAQTLYFSVSTESETHYRVTRMMLDRVRRFAARSDFIAVDLQQESEAANLMASPGNRQEISAIAHQLPKGISRSSDAALLYAVRRFRTYVLKANHPVQGVIMTEGTSDVNTLATLTEISKEIAAIDAEYSLCIVGFNPQLRTQTASAFAPLNGSVQSAQGEFEWPKCIDAMRRP